MMGADPIWLGIMIAVNLQTSFLTPPFGFALFYLRGVAPKSVLTSQIYKGVIPFIFIQLILLVLMAVFPDLVTWLPGKLYP
jgi:TRAP-type mannitol/chloroaromatic compound transport system permease large subunit